MNKCALILSFILTLHTNISNSARFIRDAETESIILKIAKPIFESAKISSKIDAHIIEDEQINAFVLDGKNIFLHTGLISFSEDPSAIAGVIAHECGHISAGHILNRTDHVNQISKASILGSILGIAGAIGGAPELGAATIMGTEEAAKRNIIGHILKQENEADIKASEYMNKLGIPNTGLISLLKALDKNARTNDYNDRTALRTHPLAKQRIDFLLRNSPISSNTYTILTPDIRKAFAMASAKVYAYTHTYAEVLKKHKGNNNADIYAQSIALFRAHKRQEALAKLNQLISKDHSNPYLYELKGQFLLTMRDTPSALMNYKAAYNILSASSLLKLQLATTMIINGNVSDIKESIGLLHAASNQEPMNTMIWRQMSIAYNKLGDLFASNIALAKEASIIDNNIQKQKFLSMANRYTRSSDKFIIQIHKDILD